MRSANDGSWSCRAEQSNYILGTGSRKLRHDLLHGILNRNSILFLIGSNDPLANPAKNDGAGSAINEIQELMKAQPQLRGMVSTVPQETASPASFYLSKK